MKIQTKLKFGKKSIYIIKVENEVWGILSKKILHTFSQDENWDMKKEEVSLLAEQIEKYAFDKVLRYLTYRERSTKEVQNYLDNLPLKSGFSEKIIDKILSYNYLNDERFCKIFISSLISKNKSKREIYQKLLQKGIDKKVAEHHLFQDYSSDIEDRVIMQQLDKAIRKYTKYNQSEKKRRCYNYLTRKGFSSDDSLRLIEKIL